MERGLNKESGLLKDFSSEGRGCTGEHSAHAHTVNSVQEILKQPKNISLASLKHKNISSFHTLTTVNELKYPEILQIEVRIPSKEPQKYHF